MTPFPRRYRKKGFDSVPYGLMMLGNVEHVCDKLPSFNDLVA